MGQVPHYLIIGRGRLARHFQHYLRGLDIPCRAWDRTQPAQHLHAYLKAPSSAHPSGFNTDLLTQAAAWRVDVALILIADDALPGFVVEHQLIQYAGHVRLCHCSATVDVPGMHYAHPLMSFTHDLYDHQRYLSIPFGIDPDGPSFHALLPALPNPHFALPQAQRAFYHAWCVLGGNMTAILWQQFFKNITKHITIDAKHLQPYCHQIHENILAGVDAVTGPLVRQDEQTMARHLQALQGNPFQCVYEAMMQAYQEVRHVGHHP